ncbi:hypothetical protein ACFSTC_44900 [Nonomuraea ferruginea]
MTSMHGGRIAIVGAAETDEIGVLPDTSMLQLHAEAGLNALRDAGLTPADVDGVATAGPLALDVAHHLGINPRWADGTMVGGCSFLLHVRHAAAAIAAGAADVVLITHGESGRSRVGAPRWGGANATPPPDSSRRRTVPSPRTPRSPSPPCASCTSAAWTGRTWPGWSSPSGSGRARTRGPCGVTSSRWTRCSRLRRSPTRSPGTCAVWSPTAAAPWC